MDHPGGPARRDGGGDAQPLSDERGRTIVALDADTASVRRQLLVSEPRNYFTVVLGCLD
ncbi:MAG TPA: hypothetical protein VFY84_10050 [Jiangellales bacterium]|nr:hypothetical protein [Jiangellales bacterium]